MNFIICSSVVTSRMLEGFICQGIYLLDQTLIHFGVLHVCVQKILKDFLKWLHFARLFLKRLKRLKKYSERFSVCIHMNDFLKSDILRYMYM